MKNTIEMLKSELENKDIAIDDEQVFDLLAVACEQCCTSSKGGNGSCPPPKAV